jgi:septum formation protein
VTLQAPSPRLILASASSARADLLRSAGLAFEILPATIDETAAKHASRAEGASAEDAALRLAELKARQIAGREPEALVIGCDQLLVCEDRWFDKPIDIADARVQLLALRGRTHILVIAVTCYRGERRLWRHVAQPRLTMRAFSDFFLDAYLAMEGDAVTTTVGGYRLEGPGIHLFDAIDGEHAAILGLPMLPMLAFLRRLGVLAA